MVGVPGRSKGCHTCLRRRVKCDESTPACRRCEKAGYKCSGYERKLEMRFHTFAERHAQPTSSTPTEISKAAPTLLDTQHVHRKLVLSSNDGGDQSSVPPEMSLVAFQESIQFAYLFNNFVWSSYGTPWLQMSAEGKIDGLSLEASRAFSLSIFGKHHHQNDIQVLGAIHYERTVRALTSRLYNVGFPGSETLIVPILILLLHSTSVPDIQASSFHIRGLLKLIQICGPERFAVDHLRPVFESCRATLVTVGLISKTRTFLEQDAWLTKPWSAIGGAVNNKNAQNQLVDILVYIPGFLQDQAQLERWPSEHLKLDLIQRIEHQIARIYDWRRRWDQVNCNTMWEIDPKFDPSYHHLSPTRAGRKVMLFSSFTTATEIALYNAVILCLFSLLFTFKPCESDLPLPIAPSQTPLFLHSEVSSLIELAVEICHAFEFQLANVHRSHDSTLFWLFPIEIASNILEDDAEYISWIRAMLSTSQVTRGYGTGQKTYGLNFEFAKIARMTTN
ncbi:hypothetical protein V1517DRAFT_329822 [Lipomyces orientalis]|uniref:Uncharacterized protein n=1 Tax=Lipomyces orientalis TaxID=1233043 RepID=A0ACC3TGG6_9ASCO